MLDGLKNLMRNICSDVHSRSCSHTKLFTVHRGWSVVAVLKRNTPWFLASECYFHILRQNSDDISPHTWDVKILCIHYLAIWLFHSASTYHIVLVTSWLICSSDLNTIEFEAVREVWWLLITWSTYGSLASANSAYGGEPAIIVIIDRTWLQSQSSTELGIYWIQLIVFSKIMRISERWFLSGNRLWVKLRAIRSSRIVDFLWSGPFELTLVIHKNKRFVILIQLDRTKKAHKVC